MPSYVVVGASRGIGLGFISQLSSDPQNTVFALIRNKATSTQLFEFVDSESNKNKNVTVLHADLTDFKTIKAAAESVSKATGGTLDVLINNGALLHQERSALTLDSFPDEETLENDLLLFFKTNVVGVVHTINAFLPLLRAGKTKKVLVVSSLMGSPSFALKAANNYGPAYSISKSALNMAIVKFAVKYQDEGLTFLTVSPGLVKTMPGPADVVDKVYDQIVNDLRARLPNFRGLVTVEESVKSQLELLEKTTPAESGTFVDISGDDGNTVVID